MSFASRIEKMWYGKSPIKWVLFLPSLLFLAITRLKRLLYRYGIFTSNDSSVPVIVVGNITVGGTGKTPFITLLASQLTEKGLRVGIVSRGYRSKAASYPHLVSINDDVNTIGDETFMQYRRLRIPMAIGANRSQVVSCLTEKYDLDLVISDDGLQHYAMGRQFEILMIDGVRGLGNGLILPFGPLREDSSRINSVDMIIQNDGERFFDWLDGISTTKAIMSLIPECLVHIRSGRLISLKDFDETAVDVVCGIGNPERFFRTLAPICGEQHRHVFPDHHDFTVDDFKALKHGCVIMTEKDAVKCQSFARENWYFLKVSASIDSMTVSCLISEIKRRLLPSNQL